MMPLAPLPCPTEPAGHAPGAPGISPTWTSSAKDIVGCALGQARLWFTIGFGIVNEVYYPRVDLPQIRDLGFIVAGPDGFWSEVKRNENYTLRLLAPGVPAVEIVHEHPRYTLRLRVTPDSRRDVLVVACHLEPVGDGGDLGLPLMCICPGDKIMKIPSFPSSPTPCGPPLRRAGRSPKRRIGPAARRSPC